ncbi:MAG: flavodoxin domain-containing protein [Boseongicola sp.]
MNVLIIYATIEGQTGKIAKFAENLVRDAGHEVRAINSQEKVSDVDFEGIEGVILAAPVHERRHPLPFEVVLSAHHDELAKRRTLLLSVSLSAAFPEGLEEANEYLVEMKMRAGFDPDEELLVAGAIRTEKYDYFASQIVRHVVLRGRNFDPNAGAHEFTNWDELSSKIGSFLSAA